MIKAKISLSVILYKRRAFSSFFYIFIQNLAVSMYGYAAGLFFYEAVKGIGHVNDGIKLQMGIPVGGLQFFMSQPSLDFF